MPAASGWARAALKDNKLRDPRKGAKASDEGASGGLEGPSRARQRPTERNANAVPARDGPHEARADQDAHQGKGPLKKRRKRRRGRKVFARDKDAVPPGPASGSPARASEGNDTAADGRRVSNGRRAPAAHLSGSRSEPRPAQHQPAGSKGGNGKFGSRSAELPVYAALDLGTNNCRLLVAVPTGPGQFRVIDAFSRIVRLGEGLSTSGRLNDNAMDRAVEALKVCGDKLRARQVRKARLIATEACRTAANGSDFLRRVEIEAGLKLEIIDRKTEARLAVSGCGSLVERNTDGVVLFDIGGGSSEIALIDISRHRTPRLANHIVSWTSLPVGVVSLAERFGGREVTPEIFEAMVLAVMQMLDGFEGRTKLAHLGADARFYLLGTSGTVTTLAGVHLGLERYDRRQVDGLWMDNANVDAMISKLLGWNFEARMANPCIGADRADLVLAGCAILEAIRRYWPSERIRVADRGLREGILSELMADDGAWRNPRRRGALGR